MNGLWWQNVTVEPKPQNTVLSIGSNTIKLTPKDIANGGKEFTITPTAKGEFTFEGDLDIYIRYGDNLVAVSGKVVLEKDVTYLVLIDTDMSYGEYLLNISFVEYDDGTGKGEFEEEEI